MLDIVAYRLMVEAFLYDDILWAASMRGYCDYDLHTFSANPVTCDHCLRNIW